MNATGCDLTEQSSLVGLPVYDCSGRCVGTVEESFVDARNSCSVFVVISVLAESDLGDERFIIPARQFRLAHQGSRRSIRLDVGIATLKGALEWSELRWIGTVNARWADCVVDRRHCDPQQPPEARQRPESRQSAAPPLLLKASDDAFGRRSGQKARKAAVARGLKQPGR